MILFERVSKRYPNGREALTNLSFGIESGEMVFLTGRSGAGKSTVLKLVALLERPTRGTVIVHGKNTSTLKSRHIPRFRRDVGMVFQDHKLLADRPVRNTISPASTRNEALDNASRPLGYRLLTLSNAIIGFVLRHRRARTQRPPHRIPRNPRRPRRSR